MNKIFQIIHIPGLLAVIGDKEGFYMIKVSHIRLIEDDTGRREVLVIPWRGKLTGIDEVTDFIGICDSQSRADGVWLRSLTDEQYEIHKPKSGLSAINWTGGILPLIKRLSLYLYLNRYGRRRQRKIKEPEQTFYRIL